MKKLSVLKIVNADRPLVLDISLEDVRNAKCGDPTQCVLAQTMLRSPLGSVAEGFFVGPSITKIMLPGSVVVRHSTPAKLKNALKTFDKTGLWKLPPGEYKLLPLSKSYRRPGRWHKKRNSGGTQSVFVGRELPTRDAGRIFLKKDAA